MEINDDVRFILYRINYLERRQLEFLDSQRFLTTHRNIWAGSYDCWNGHADREQQIKKPFIAMELAEKEGLIKSETKEYVFWTMTELGKNVYYECGGDGMFLSGNQ